MSDLLKGLTGGSWSLLFAWVLPSALALGAIWILIYPLLANVPISVAIGSAPAAASAATGSNALVATGLSFGDRCLILLVISFALGLVLNAISTPLYRLLE